MNLMKSICIILTGLFSLVSEAMEIKGRIEIGDEWQPVVYLASLNSPEALFVASPDFIIAETFIQPDGTFILKTENVKEDYMFYRLYLVRGDNSVVEFNTTRNKNYIHLLLNRNSFIEIEAEIKSGAFEVLELNGSDECKAMLDFDKNYAQQKGLLAGELTKAKSTFLSHELEVFIRNFVNESSSAMVALYALYHIDAKDTDFLRNSEFYFNFQERLEKDFPNTAYTQAYSELIVSLVGFRDFVCEMPGVQEKWKDRALIIETILILILLIIIVWLLVIQRKTMRSQIKNESLQSAFYNLTSKQQEILELLAAGKTNKEIALDLFVELSTVKTHINNIYRQLGVTTRKEAIDYYRSLQK